MKLAELPLKRPVGTVMLLVSLMVLGLVALKRLPLEFMPTFAEPEIDITASLPGSHPLEALRDVAMQIEGEVATIEGVTSTFSNSSQGRARVEVQFSWSEDMDLKLSVMAESGLPVDRLRQVRIGSPNLQAEAVRQGLGAALFNASIARSDILSGDVVEVPLPGKAYVTYFAVYPKGPRHALIDPFVNWLESLI